MLYLINPNGCWNERYKEKIEPFNSIEIPLHCVFFFSQNSTSLMWSKRRYIYVYIYTFILCEMFVPCLRSAQICCYFDDKRARWTWVCDVCERYTSIESASDFENLTICVQNFVGCVWTLFWMSFFFPSLLSIYEPCQTIEYASSLLQLKTKRLQLMQNKCSRFVRFFFFFLLLVVCVWKLIHTANVKHIEYKSMKKNLNEKSIRYRIWFGFIVCIGVLIDTPTKIFLLNLLNDLHLLFNW